MATLQDLLLSALAPPAAPPDRAGVRDLLRLLAPPGIPPLDPLDFDLRFRPDILPEFGPMLREGAREVLERFRSPASSPVVERVAPSRLTDEPLLRQLERGDFDLDTALSHPEFPRPFEPLSPEEVERIKLFFRLHRLFPVDELEVAL